MYECFDVDRIETRDDFLNDIGIYLSRKYDTKYYELNDSSVIFTKCLMKKVLNENESKILKTIDTFCRIRSIDHILEKHKIKVELDKKYEVSVEITNETPEIIAILMNEKS